MGRALSVCAVPEQALESKRQRPRVGGRGSALRGAIDARCEISIVGADGTIAPVDFDGWKRRGMNRPS